MIRDINTLKQWFIRKAKPLQSQFSDLFDSYWHKNDTINITDIYGLQNILSGVPDPVILQAIAQNGLKVVSNTTELQTINGTGDVPKVVLVKNNGLYAFNPTGIANGTTIFNATGGVWELVIKHIAYAAEDAVNKATDFSTLNHNKYPTTLAVNNLVSQLSNSLNWKKSVLCATVSALPSCTLSSDGLTLTATSNGVFPVIDGIDCTSNDNAPLRILVKNQVDKKQNGIYDFTYLGDPGNPWRLTRSSDADTTDKIKTATVYVRNGSVEKARVYCLTSTSYGSDMGSILLTATLINQVNTYVNGVGILMVGNVFSLDPSYVATVMAANRLTGYTIQFNAPMVLARINIIYTGVINLMVKNDDLSAISFRKLPNASYTNVTFSGNSATVNIAVTAGDTLEFQCAYNVAAVLGSLGLRQTVTA